MGEPFREDWEDLLLGNRIASVYLFKIVVDCYFIINLKVYGMAQNGEVISEVLGDEFSLHILGIEGVSGLFDLSWGSKNLS
jgi:hypothetical protein